MTSYYIELRTIDIDGDGDNDNIRYYFEGVRGLDETGNKPFTAVEASNALNNQQLGFAGKTIKLPVEWIITNGSDNSNLLNDKSNGTWNSNMPSGYDDNIANDTVVTVEEQIYYLQRYIQIATLGAQWRLFGGIYTDPDGDGTDEGTPVVIENLSIRRQNGGNNARATMQLKVGQGL